MGVQKKSLIETDILSTHNIRGHMFWLKLIKGNIPIFFYVSMISFIIMKEGSYSEPSIGRVKCCDFCLFDLILTSLQQSFIYVWTGLPGLNQY